MSDTGDYISRDYVLNCMEDSYKNAGISAEAKAKMTRWLKNAPAAIDDLQKPKTGTWHMVKASKRSYMFVCNSCARMYPYLTRCCPNCGVLYIDEEPPKEDSHE